MDLVILFDWFTNESMDAALQATEWQQREMFLRLALMWGTAAQQCPKKHRPKRRLTQHRVDRRPVSFSTPRSAEWAANSEPRPERA